MRTQSIRPTRRSRRRSATIAAFTYVLLTVALGSTVASGQSSVDLVARATAPVPRDHYLLTLTLTRNSRDERHAPGKLGHRWANVRGPSLDLVEVEHGPLVAQMRLMPIVGGTPLDRLIREHHEVELAGYLLFRDVEWATLDDEKEASARRQRGEFFEREYGALGEAMPELEQRLSAIDAHAEDVELLLRLIHGVTSYRWTESHEQPVHVPEGEAPVPTAGPIVASFGGASWDRRYTVSGGGGSGELNSTSKLAGWSTEDLVDGRPEISVQSFRGETDLDVWTFDAADLGRVGELLSETETLRASLCEWSPEIRSSAAGTSLLNGKLDYWQQRFCQPFFGGLRQVVELAWHLAPADLPGDLFDADGALRTDVGLRLPEIGPSPWFRLQFPERVLRDDGAGHNEPAAGISRGTDPEDGSWNEEVEDWADFTWFNHLPGHGRQPLTGISGAQRVRQRLPSDGRAVNQARLFIHGQGGGERFAGSFVAHWHTEKVVADTRRTLEDQLTVGWRLQLGGEPGVRPEERLELRLVEHTEDGFVPIEGAVGYGRPFFLEGRLEEEPIRDVYVVTLLSPGGEERKVFLEPTAEDRKLLRSELLYLMWELEGDDDARP